VSFIWTLTFNQLYAFTYPDKILTFFMPLTT
jgi:hypothetical protein